MKAKIKLKLAILFTCMLYLSCAPKQNEKKTESIQLRAYRLLDDNKVDDAISLLTDEIDKRDQVSENEFDASVEVKELRVTLASAYAKKSGIRIFEIAKSFELGKKISSFKIQEMNKSSHNSKSESSQKIKFVSNLLLTQLKFLQSISVIPQVDQDKTIYLQLAVRILNSTLDLSPADLVYSAILKIILVRTLFESDKFKSILPRFEKVDNQCIAKLSEFRDHLGRASKILLSGFEDIGKAMPEKKQEVLVNSKSIIELTEKVITLNAAGVVIYSVDSNALSYIYDLLGMDGSQAINCEPNEISVH